MRSIFSFTLQELLSQNCQYFHYAGRVPLLELIEHGHPLTVNLACLDRIADSLGALAIHLAANRESSTQNLLHDTLQGLGERLEAHRSCNLDNLVQGDRLVVLDVLLLLAVTRGLLQSANDERRGCRNDGHGGLTVLDRKLDSNAETLLYIGENCNL